MWRDPPPPKFLSKSGRHQNPVPDNVRVHTGHRRTLCVCVCARALTTKRAQDDDDTIAPLPDLDASSLLELERRTSLMASTSDQPLRSRRSLLAASDGDAFNGPSSPRTSRRLKSADALGLKMTLGPLADDAAARNSQLARQGSDLLLNAMGAIDADTAPAGAHRSTMRSRMPQHSNTDPGPAPPSPASATDDGASMPATPPYLRKARSGSHDNDDATAGDDDDDDDEATTQEPSSPALSLSFSKDTTTSEKTTTTTKKKKSKSPRSISARFILGGKPRRGPGAELLKSSLSEVDDAYVHAAAANEDHDETGFAVDNPMHKPAAEEFPPPGPPVGAQHARRSSLAQTLTGVFKSGGGETPSRLARHSSMDKSMIDDAAAHGRLSQTGPGSQSSAGSFARPRLSLRRMISGESA